MSNNPEFSNTNSSENGAWGNILPKDNFYQHKQSLEEAFNRLESGGQEEVSRWRSIDSNSADASDIAEGIILMKQ